MRTFIKTRDRLKRSARGCRFVKTSGCPQLRGLGAGVSRSDQGPPLPPHRLLPVRVSPGRCESNQTWHKLSGGLPVKDEKQLGGSAWRGGRARLLVSCRNSYPEDRAPLAGEMTLLCDGRQHGSFTGPKWPDAVSGLAGLTLTSGDLPPLPSPSPRGDSGTGPHPQGRAQ